MLVNRVRIENFKRFAELSVDLSSFDCLVGPCC
jgi:predicted ATP-dependent endonuclease of OLD family